LHHVEDRLDDLRSFLLREPAYFLVDGLDDVRLGHSRHKTYVTRVYATRAIQACETSQRSPTSRVASPRNGLAKREGGLADRDGTHGIHVTGSEPLRGVAGPRPDRSAPLRREVFDEPGDDRLVGP